MEITTKEQEMAPKFNIQRPTKIRSASHAVSSFEYYLKKAREEAAKAKEAEAK